MARSDVRRAQKQALTVVDRNDTFMEAISLLAALHLANKCKSKGEKRGSGRCGVSTTISTTAPVNGHLHENIDSGINTFREIQWLTRGNTKHIVLHAIGGGVYKLLIKV